MAQKHTLQPPFGWTWRAAFSSDGSESTGSKERDGQAFTVIRQLTTDEADPIENGPYAGHVALWEVEFGDGGRLVAWDDEIINEVVREGEG